MLYIQDIQHYFVFWDYSDQEKLRIGLIKNNCDVYDCNYSYYLTWQMLCYIFVTAIGIFTLCSIIEFVRAKIFKLLKIDKGIDILSAKIDEKIKNLFNNISKNEEV